MNYKTLLLALLAPAAAFAAKPATLDPLAALLLSRELNVLAEMEKLEKKPTPAASSEKDTKSATAAAATKTISNIRCRKTKQRYGKYLIRFTKKILLQLKRSEAKF